MTPDQRAQFDHKLRAIRSTLADHDGDDDLCNVLDMLVDCVELLGTVKEYTVLDELRLKHLLDRAHHGL